MRVGVVAFVGSLIAGGGCGASASGGTNGTETAATESSSSETGTATTTDGSTASSGSTTGAGTTTGGGPPPARVWSAPENISNSPEFSDLRINWGNSLAVTAAGTVHAVWREVTDPNATPLISRVEHRRRVAGAWEAVATLADAASGIGHPKVAASGARVHVTWHVYDPGGTDSILVRSSSSDGAAGSFAAPVTIVNDAVVTNQSGELSTSPSISAWNDGVHVVWSDDRVVMECGQSVPEIYMNRSLDGGQSWSGVQPVSTRDCHTSWTPTVWAHQGNVHVAWTDERDGDGDCGLGLGPCDEEEYYARLTDDGQTPAVEEVRLTEDPAGAFAQSWAGNIAAAGDGVHYAYMDNGGGDDFEVYYRRSLDRGVTWAEPAVQLSAHGVGCLAARPTTAVNGDAVHVTWFEMCNDTEATIMHRWSTDAGESWSAPSDVTAGTGTFAIQPSVAVHGNEVHVIWTDQGEIFHAWSEA